MTSLAKAAYTDTIDTVESHQVILAKDEQYWFISNAIEVLEAKRDALLQRTDYDEEDSRE
jgi:hypothetical protein